MDRKLKMHYRKKMNGGRSLVARVLDFVFLRTLMLTVLFIVSFRLFRSLTSAILMAVIITTLFSLILILINRKRQEKFMRKDMQRLKKKCLLEELTLMDKEDFKQYMNRLLDGSVRDAVDTDDGFLATSDTASIYVFHNHPSSVCGAADILRAYRRTERGKKLIIISLSSFNKDANAFISGFEKKISLIDGDTVLEAASIRDLLPDEERAGEKAAAEMAAAALTLGKIKKAAFGRVKTRAYIICGIIIACWPFVAGFRFYYPIIAVFCFALALISYRKAQKSPKQVDIGIS